MFRFAIAAGLMLAFVAGCDRGTQSSAPSQGEALPAGLILDVEPTGAQDLAAAKQAAKEGDEVVVRGVIGGRTEPLASNRALLMLIDPSVTTCDQMATDACVTSWDACCEDPDVIVAKSATVQVVDEQGQPMRQGLSGVGGIAPNKRVVIKGTVRESEGQNMVIDATGVYVEE